MRAIVLSVLLIFCGACFAQSPANCPQNIGFEQGGFQNWQCFAGTRTQDGTLNLNPAVPLSSRHSIISSASAATDKYGKFPVSCPNGSNYSVMLGNDKDGAEAERISYTFTVPANRNDYSIIFDYAVVFSFTSTESRAEKAGFSAKIFDVAADKYIECSSFEFVPEPNSANTFQASNRVDVFYKPWSAASINLSGYAGKVLRLEFTTRDCYYTDNGNGHFCYAYFDINDFCGPPVRNAVFCDPSALTLFAPFGFKEYQWYNEDMSVLLGTGDKLRLQPAPPVNTRFALKIVPFDNAGCTDILYPVIVQGQGVTGFSFPKIIQACSETSIDLTDPQNTAGNDPSLTYAYFTDAEATEHLLNPSSIVTAGTYYVRATNESGCSDIRSVELEFTKVQLQVSDPPVVYYPYSADITSGALTMGSSPGLALTYWLDAGATISLVNPNTVSKSGTYYIKGAIGNCYEIKKIEVVVKDVYPDTFTPNGDGINDVFNTLNASNMRTIFFRIFNRWGQIVFDSRQQGSAWDGTVNSKKQPSGTYYWQWDSFDETSRQKITRSGQVILIR